MNISDYYKSIRTARQLNQEMRKLTDKADKDKHEITWKYRDQIHELERKRNAEINDIETQVEATKEGFNKRLQPHYDIIHATEYVFDLIDCHIDDQLFLFLTPDKDLPLVINDLDEYEKEELERRLKGEPKHLGPLIVRELVGARYSGKIEEIPPFKVLADDEYKKMGVYVIETNKPKNKYGLKIYVKTIFRSLSTSNILKDYRWIKDGPSIEFLTKWYERNEASIKTQYLDPFKPIEKEYEEALELFKEPEWRIAYLNHKKYYYENHYSQGTETKEYKKVLECLKEFV